MAQKKKGTLTTASGSPVADVQNVMTALILVLISGFISVRVLIEQI
jgi:hypothetical protein